MRCPNCGNENPDDYTFCDECGAKLTPQEGGAEAQTMVAEADSPVSAPISTPLDGATVMESADVASPVMAAGGGVCPNCGAATVPGEAYCNECGAELATVTAEAADAVATADAGIPGTGSGAGAPTAEGELEPYMGGMASDTGSAMPSADTGLNGRSREVPMTEDTLAPTAESATAEGEDMPGVVPMPTAEEDAGAMMPAMPAPAVGSGVMDSTGAWATSALTQLEGAQQAMAKGDWVEYGQTMSSLKAFLESVVEGAPPASATAPAMPAPMPAPASMDAEAPSVTEAAAATEPAAAYSSGGLTGARLVMISNGVEMPLPQQEEITVGREDPSSGIFPDIDLTPYGGEDGGVSRRHARMLHIGSDYYIEDLQSTNYTKLDGQRLPARVREKLEDGARIDFGRVAVIFRKS